MGDLGRLIDVVNRSLTGPVVSEADFDMTYVAQGLKRVVEDYEIRVDPEHVVNVDDGLADRVFEAAVVFLAGCGVYSKDTGRVIRYSEDEIRELLKQATDGVSVGDGADARRDTYRAIDEDRPPLLMAGPIGSPAPNELFVPIMRSYIQEPIADLTCAATLTTIADQEIRTKSPLEILACWKEIELMAEARRLAGRPGIATTSFMLSISDIGHLSATSSPHNPSTDLQTFGVISELKTNNDILDKLAHIVMTQGVVDPFANPIYGGLGGGVDGQAVLIAASMIALSVVFLGDCLGSSPTHPLRFNDTGSEVMSASSLAFQALARNTRLLTNLTLSPVGGPGTDTLLYECVAYGVMCTLSGCSRVLGPRSATGVVAAHFSGLEARFLGEVMRAAVGLDRERGDEIVHMAMEKYEALQDEKPYGEPFPEVYDVDTVEPKPGWLKLYEEVKSEAAGWGLSFEA